MVYDAQDGSILKRLKGHKDTILCVTALINGGVASGGADNTVIIWNQKYEGVLKYTHSHSIQSLQQDPVTGLYSSRFLNENEIGILVSCTSSEIGLWSSQVKSVNKIKVPSRALCVCWTRDGSHFAVGLYDGKVSIRSKLGEEKTCIQREGPIWGLSWTVIAGTDVLTVSDWKQRISFYNVSGKQIGKDRILDFDPVCICHDYENSAFIIGGSDKTLTLWTSEGIKLAPIGVEEDWIWSCKVRPNQNQIAFATQGTLLFI